MRVLSQLPPCASRATLVLVIVVLLLIANGIVWPYLPNAGPIREDDFIEYWAAARLQLRGQNPYDPALVFVVQRAEGWAQDKPKLMWNPPHMITLALPFAYLDYRNARMLWLELIVLTLLMCSDRLFAFYGGRSAAGRRLMRIMAVVSVPALFMILEGQIGWLLLIGLVGFLELQARRKDLAAGAFLPLIALKPQLLYLFWIGLLVWVIRERRFRILLGALLSTLVLSLPLLVSNPDVFGQYLRAAASGPHRDWITPTIGAALRLFVGWEMTWLQYVPVVFGMIWLVMFVWNRRKEWYWANDIQWLVLASFAVGIYYWVHDLVLVLVPLVSMWAIAGRRTRSAILALSVAWLALNLVMLRSWMLPAAVERGLLWSQPNQAWNIWIAPCILLLCWAGQHIIARTGPGCAETNDSGETSKSGTTGAMASER